jgi:tmRNA-binding protein
MQVEIGLCKGKKTADKRETIKERDSGREMRRTLKSEGY